MRTRSHRWLLLLYGGALLVALIASVRNPVALQKVTSVVEVRNGGIPDIDDRGSLDVERVVGGIPFDPEVEGLMIWDVHPDRKYQRTFVEGRGNCSNFVFGLARHLQRSGMDFQIVHMMRPKDVLEGRGHTLIRTRYRHAGTDRVGLIDVFAGGLPRSGDRFLDVPDLRAPIRDFAILSWNGRADLAEDFFLDLPEDAVIGWIPRAEVERYFAFLERVYLPLPSTRLEKYVYDALALFFGFYPTIYVTDAAPLRAASPVAWHFYPLALWLFRSAVLLLPLFAWLEWRGRRGAAETARAGR